MPGRDGRWERSQERKRVLFGDSGHEQAPGVGRQTATVAAAVTEMASECCSPQAVKSPCRKKSDRATSILQTKRRRRVKSSRRFARPGAHKES